jgi:hypothetical protein
VNDRSYLPEQPQGRSVYEARSKRSRFSRLTDGKNHPVVVKRLQDEYDAREEEAWLRCVDEAESEEGNHQGTRLTEP